MQNGVKTFTFTNIRDVLDYAVTKKVVGTKDLSKQFHFHLQITYKDPASMGEEVPFTDSQIEEDQLPVQVTVVDTDTKEVKRTFTIEPDPETGIYDFDIAGGETAQLEGIPVLFRGNNGEMMNIPDLAGSGNTSSYSGNVTYTVYEDEEEGYNNIATSGSYKFSAGAFAGSFSMSSTWTNLYEGTHENGSAYKQVRSNTAGSSEYAAYGEQPLSTSSYNSYKIILKCRG